MKKYKNIIFFLLPLSILLNACEDVIDLDLEERPNQLVVDAFLTNNDQTQIVRLTSSAPYFDNQPTPGIKGASVKVIGPNNTEYTFIDQGDGNYQYLTVTNGKLDSIDFDYKLELVYNGNLYTAISRLNPVPPIDTMLVTLEEEELGSEAGYYVEFYATDFAGRKDYYWIKSFKNGVSITPDNPSALILSEDAAFGGNGADGFVFIAPIREAVTNDDDPFAVGDECRVELLSVNGDAYQFLDQVTIQANNGGLFSTPPSNIRSNIKDANGNPQEEVLGVFSLSSISVESIVITE